MGTTPLASGRLKIGTKDTRVPRDLVGGTKILVARSTCNAALQSLRLGKDLAAKRAIGLVREGTGGCKARLRNGSTSRTCDDPPVLGHLGGIGLGPGGPVCQIQLDSREQSTAAGRRWPDCASGLKQPSNNTELSKAGTLAQRACMQGRENVMVLAASVPQVGQKIGVV